MVITPHKKLPYAYYTRRELDRLKILNDSHIVAEDSAGLFYGSGATYEDCYKEVHKALQEEFGIDNPDFILDFTSEGEVAACNKKRNAIDYYKISVIPECYSPSAPDELLSLAPGVLKLITMAEPPPFFEETLVVLQLWVKNLSQWSELFDDDFKSELIMGYTRILRFLRGLINTHVSLQGFQGLHHKTLNQLPPVPKYNTVRDAACSIQSKPCNSECHFAHKPEE